MEIENSKIGQLVIDVYLTKSYFVVQIPIAGVEEKDLEVKVENKILFIKGKREESEEEKKEEKDYLKKECYWGPFSAEISLPEDANNSQIKASFKKGVLLIKIPRIKKEPEKKVTIET